MKPTSWWRVIAADGSVWCETSNEQEARNNLRPGDTLYRMYQSIEVVWKVES